MSDEKEQKKSERLHMLISPAELDAIDDWRFKNRLGTRAEAVRRLVRIGLAADASFLDLIDSYTAIFARAWELALHDENEEEAEKIIEQAAELGIHFGKMRGAIVTMRGGDDTDEAVNDLKSLEEEYARNGSEGMRAMLRASRALAKERKE